MDRLKTDVLFTLVLVLITGLFACRYVNFGIPPFEDAAMLMRYASHFAQGEGLVWNVGDPPIDGATDFLFTLAVGILHRSGLPLEWSVRGLSVASHVLTVVLIYLTVRVLQRSGMLAALGSALFFAIGPGLYLAAAYFGTPFFTLSVAAVWLIAQRIILVDTRSRWHYVAFSFAAVLMGLIRPEGVFMAAFIFVAAALMIPARDARHLGMMFGAVFLLFGGAYFAWRWQYFGYPLPNPFYKKGGGYLHVSSLQNSLSETLRLCGPFLLGFLLALRQKASAKTALAFAIPIAGSSCMWVLLSNEMNFYGRFQYPIFALAILSWYPLVSTAREDLKLPRWNDLSARARLAVLLTMFAVLVGLFRHQAGISRAIAHSHDGRYDVGIMLSRYSGRGYTLATSEAGLLPLYSQWRAVDTWGLNDQWIAHHGGVTEEYLDRLRPEVLVSHAYFSPVAPPGPNQGDPWARMVMTIKRYAEKNNYILAASFGVSPYDTHYYYVRSDIAEAGAIVDGIRSIRYAWYGTGETCVNYADFSPGRGALRHQPRDPVGRE